MTEDLELSFEDLTFEGEFKVNKISDQKEENKKEESNNNLNIINNNEEEDNSNIVLVYTAYGLNLPINSVLQYITTKITDDNGKPLKIKLHNYREKQCFAFIQFFDHLSVEKCLEKLNDIEIDNLPINCEICNKITPGRDPRTHDFNSEYKNSTLVFKNLPFQLKQEKLEEILNQYPWKPLNVSYLYDEGTGLFRGMAFVKYKDIEQGMKAFEAMNGMDIQGRKLRIEYKRKVKEVESPSPSSFEDEISMFYMQLNNFKTSSSLTELAFPCQSSYQRKQIHQIAEKLGLGHYSTGEGEHKYVLVKKKENNHLDNHGQPIKDRKKTNNSSGIDSKHNSFRSSSYEHKWGSSPEKRNIGSHSFAGISSKWSSFSPPYTNSINFSNSTPNSLPLLGTSPTFRKPLQKNNPINDNPSVIIIRQPKGPDGTNGFHQDYKKSRTYNKVIS